jgi:hypothetical protein
MRIRPATSLSVLGAALVTAAACTTNNTTIINEGSPDGAASGSASGTEAATGTSGGSSGGEVAEAGSLLGFTPSNFDPSTLDVSGAGDAEVTSGLTLETDLGGTFGALPYHYQEVTQPGGPKLGVFVVHSLKIDSTATVRVLGADALVIVALDTITIDGHLLGDSADPNKGPGAADQTDNTNVVGLGGGGGGAGTATTSGGGGGYCGAGGVGASLVGASDDAVAGMTFGQPTLIPLVAGSNGGSGFGAGGDGGGAIQLVAAHGITVTGTVSVGGRAGGPSGVYQAGFASNEQAGGGGSGGAILIESPTVSVSGTLAANGGGGGGSMEGISGIAGATAAAGGVADLTHAAGGPGSAGATVVGSAGATLTGAASGGGGGGAGRIRINTTSGAATLAGTISPDATTACLTQGTLK